VASVPSAPADGQLLRTVAEPGRPERTTTVKFAPTPWPRKLTSRQERGTIGEGDVGQDHPTAGSHR
jgi:hypothetical protein